MMKDYKLSEIKKICKEHYQENEEGYCDCPLWEYPDACSIIRMTNDRPTHIPKNWWRIDGEDNQEN